LNSCMKHKYNLKGTEISVFPKKWTQTIPFRFKSEYWDIFDDTPCKVIVTANKPFNN
jgi:hypothetical protein